MEKVLGFSISNKSKAIIKEYTEAILIALVLALFVRTFIIQAFKIPSGSMKDTLLVGDHILVYKLGYGLNLPFKDFKLPFENHKLFTQTPEKGDIVVFKYPEDEERDFIKRVVATPGDKLQIKEQKIYINDMLIEEPFSKHTEPSNYLQGRDNLGPITIPENKIFVMGDNRENSHDSRFWGFVDTKKVIGKAIIIYWSWNSKKTNVRFNRLAKLLK